MEGYDRHVGHATQNMATLKNAFLFAVMKNLHLIQAKLILTTGTVAIIALSVPECKLFVNSTSILVI